MPQVQVIKPDAFGIFPHVTFEDISQVNDSFVFELGGSWDYMTIQLVPLGDVTLGSLVNKIRCSNDGANPLDFTSGAVTLSTATITSQLTVTAVRYVHSTLTTAGTSGKLRLFAVAARKRLA